MLAASLNRTFRVAIGSLGIALAVLALKFGAWWLTGSVALFADALESVVNVAAALAALLAVRLAAVPPDANHPYGHTKAEYISAVLEGVLIVVAALVILHEAWAVFLAPRVPQHAPLGLAVSAVATLLNFLWARMLFREGRKGRSPALLADGKHLMADVVTSIGVLLGVAGVALTGQLWLDPLLAAVTALNILWSGGRLVRDSVSGLMDEAVDAELLGRIRAAVSAHAAGAIEAHDLRTRHAGRLIFIQFHLVVPGGMTVDAAHEICDRVEAALKSEIEGAIITIHVEPEGKAKHHGVLVL
ncbi:cation diffusion facilitator family transporter [Siccirubricoccus sp. KC 17139]|uniref:Cation diffusion facilitator family transporter n=1 Tax=Siccirubricoccus soli TaxID=2899147 RepID=A0ABT1D0Q5_9PROT|nr:cation diffusion facilitator family transporter [Siccirubricoccus soli]MCO6415490.1 cation diffusion facilitator family transporter [Siccirubricoccus soli]MCP2681622.1 cation diffusion facilitator family transporter [Siccirubricoccus soli]